MYPAMLSHLAMAFKESVELSTHTKDLLEYTGAFSGKQAVDVICRILRSKDRNLGVILGRALDSQGFIHDVNYTARLRDSPFELYKLAEPIGANAITPLPVGIFTVISDCYSPTCTKDRLCYSIICPRRFEQVRIIKTASSK